MVEFLQNDKFIFLSIFKIMLLMVTKKVNCKISCICSWWALFKSSVATVQSTGGISIATKWQRPFDIRLILVMLVWVTALTATGISTDCADTPTTGSFLNHRFRTGTIRRGDATQVITIPVTRKSLQARYIRQGKGDNCADLLGQAFSEVNPLFLYGTKDLDYS